jgi:hypothetical protein
MSDDSFTRSVNNNQRYGKMKTLAIIALGAACVIGAYSMTSQTSTQEAFLQNEDYDYDFDFESELELRRGRGGGQWKDIDADRVN